MLEDDEGQTHLVGADDLRPLLVGERDLRLVVLSACQSAQTGGLDAFDGVATGLLQADLPAVLAMQFSILDNSAIELARIFYTELARGQTPAQALLAGAAGAAQPRPETRAGPAPLRLGRPGPLPARPGHAAG